MSTLPTKGRVLIQTTVGDIEVELWAKETPLACRNFLSLSLEGYYDGVLFHRVVPNFMVQTGDRTGTGNGGESFYGEPFDDEIHPRLRFTHRGLVAMANNGDKNSNTSQFFITLDRAEELHGKHTLFGRVIGDTIYNVVKIGELELDENERPIYPPKIKQIRILDDPFGDIIPRITAAEKRAQQLAKEQVQKERAETGKRRQGKKDTKLLSFGDDADSNEGTQFKKKPLFRTDLLDDPEVGKIPVPLVSSSTKVKVSGTSAPDQAKESVEKTVEEPLLVKKPKKVETKSESDKKKAELQKVEDEIRRLTRQRESDSEDDKPSKKTKKGPSIIEQQNAKYQRGQAAARKSGRKRDENDVLSALQSFRGKLQQARGDSDEEVSMDAAVTADVGDAQMEVGEDEGMEVDDDVDWINHRLHFSNDNSAEVSRAEHDYEVIDPRMRGAKAKEEEMERKREKTRKDGGRGFHPRSSHQSNRR